MYSIATLLKSYPLHLRERFIVLCENWHIITKPKGHCDFKSIMILLHCCFFMQQHFICAYKLQCGAQKDLFLNATFCQDAAVGALWREPCPAPREMQVQNGQLLRFYRFQVLGTHFSLWHHWILYQSPLSTCEIQLGSVSIKGNFYCLTNHFE